MTSYFPHIRLMLVAAIVVTAGCEAPTASIVDGTTATESFAAADLETLLATELDMTSEQTAAVQSTMATLDRPERNPGSLWILSSRLQEDLTEAQKERLFELASRARGRHVLKLVGVYAPCVIGRFDGSDRRVPLHIIADLLTDEQLAEAEEIRGRFHEEKTAIHEQVRAGTLTREEAGAQLDELHDALVAAIYGLLTDEQIEALKQRIADRGVDAEAHLANSKRAMIEALGLTDDQVAALDELHRDQCAAIQEIIATDSSRQVVFEAALRLSEQKIAEYERILDRVQFEAAAIHDALLVINARRFVRHLHDRLSDRSG